MDGRMYGKIYGRTDVKPILIPPSLAGDNDRAYLVEN